MPDRIVRENILDSDRVNILSFGAEVLYRRLMSIADDYGRMESRVTSIKGKCYPVRPNDDITNSDVAGWLQEIAAAGLILLYQVLDKQYLEILNFRQRLRTPKSRYPAPINCTGSTTYSFSMIPIHMAPPSNECQTSPLQTNDGDSPSFVGQSSDVGQSNDGHMSDVRQSLAAEEKRREEKRIEEKGREKAPEEPAPGAAPAAPPPAPESSLKAKQAAMLSRQKIFQETVMGYADRYSAEMLQAFLRHWTEPNKSRTKMKFEMESTWDVIKRLVTWETRDQQWSKPRGQPAGGSSASNSPGIAMPQDLDFLYGRFVEEAQIGHLVQEKHCDLLIQLGLIDIDERFTLEAINRRIKGLVGTNQASELRMIAAYQAGTWRTDEDCRKDEPNRARLAKKLALYDFFKRAKALNLKTISDAQPIPAS